MNVITNHDFSSGLDPWYPNECKASVVSPKSNRIPGISKMLGCCQQHAEITSQRHARITNRKETWQGLEQDITALVSAGSRYTVAAHVGISGAADKVVDGVKATLRLENGDSTPEHKFISSTSVSENKWEVLEGTFSLSTLPQKVVFYIEGPSPGVDLLIKLVVISCSSSAMGDKNSRIPGSSFTTNVINNHDFSSGLESWHMNNCMASVVSPKSNRTHARITGRKKTWQGLEQDITARVSVGSNYTVAAHVGISSAADKGVDNVQATLRLEYGDSETEHVFISSKSVSENNWEVLEGTFSLSNLPQKVVFYIEGPSPDVDLLIKLVVISCLSSVMGDVAMYSSSQTT